MTTGAQLQGATIGNYVVRQEIGNGGMGAVYLVEHTMLGRRAALKVLHPEMSANQEMVQRFFNEARAASAIKSPGIVEIYDFGFHTNGSAYIVMELLEGESLSMRLGRYRSASPPQGLPVQQALVIARQIASALAPAHRAGIVHRDLKPDNLFLVPDSEAASGERTKILDFGIAKLSGEGLGGASNLTSTKVVMGSPHYMSPEQCRSIGVDARSDLYALGCILYECLAGRPPFLGEAFIELMAAHLSTTPPPLAQLVAGIPMEVEAVVQRLLAKNPAQRFQTADEVASALNELVGQLRSVSVVAQLQPSAATLHMAPGSHPHLPAMGHRTPMPGTPMPGTPMPGTPLHSTPGPMPRPLTPSPVMSPMGAMSSGPVAMRPGQPGPHTPYGQPAQQGGYGQPGQSGQYGQPYPTGQMPPAGQSYPTSQPAQMGSGPYPMQPMPGMHGSQPGLPAPGSPTTMRHSSGAATTPPTKRSSSARTILLVAGSAGLLGSAVMAVIMLSGGEKKAASLADNTTLPPLSADAGPAVALDAAVAVADAAVVSLDAATASASDAGLDAASVIADAGADAAAKVAGADAGVSPARTRRKKVEVLVDAAPELPETLSSSAQAAGVDPLNGAVRACATSRGAKPSSTVYVVIDVMPSGRVREARVTSSNDASLSACVTSTIIRATFAPTQKGGSFRKIYMHQ